MLLMIVALFISAIGQNVDSDSCVPIEIVRDREPSGSVFSRTQERYLLGHPDCVAFMKNAIRTQPQIPVAESGMR